MHIFKEGKKLRLGYTTGSCATAAATASLLMLFKQEYQDKVLISLPEGQKVVFNIEDAEFTKDWATCSVVKDAGDDPDVTDGIKIFAHCTFTDKKEGISLKGGEGVGLVQGKGLALSVGEVAINPVPRKMILENLEAISKAQDYEGGIEVEISAPGGEEIAQKTFNPRLGIVGGISILGTTGIVEPMSEKALIDTICLLIDRQSLVNAENIIISPGNYGKNFARDRLGIESDDTIKFSNFLGECLDYLAYKKFKNVLLVGHLGKMIKVAGGIMNTHSSVADCRMEIIAAHAACAGAKSEAVQAIMDCRTTDEAMAILEDKGLEKELYARVLEKILFHLNYRLKNSLNIELIVFLQDRIIMQSSGAEALVKKISGRGL